MIFTGHGGGSYKKCGIDDKKLSFLKKHFYNKSGKMVSYAISPSMMTSKDYNTEYNIDDGRILNFGAPRNDIFFSDRPDIIKKTKELYNIDEITHIVLFAPTFRGAADSASTINLYKVKNIMDALYNRFGQKFVLMVRAHHTIKASLLENDNEILDGNLIDDMQELLYTCDILITDYSSCMWDCCIAGKPLFLYTPDVVEYEKERGLTIPISQWGFPLAKTLDELIKNITDFNYDLHKKAIIEHKLLMGSYETGTATESCVRLINNLTCNVQ
jgi:CDP-glycerol glycerophosphotransferase